MSQPSPQMLSVGTPPSAREIAHLHQPGEANAAGIMFLPGFKSDMYGSKAEFLSQFCATEGREFVRFDYSGHGVSGGEFLDGTISKWLEESIAIFDYCMKSKTILVGSSMGGWLAMLLNQHLRKRGDDRVAGIVLIAPAVDMTAELLEPSFTPSEREEYERDNQVTRPSDYGEPYIFTRQLIEDGSNHLMFGDKIVTGCPVHILQGVLDKPVPVSHSQKLLDHLLLDTAQMSVVPDGDHSLSRPQDLELLERAIRSMDHTISGQP